jgi:RNA polymerase sigma-70 factor (ECF subfamily)
MALGREEAYADSFDIVYNAHHAYVHGLVYALLGDAQDAEDVTQEVFVNVYRSLPTYKPERAAMRTWLTRVAVNACRAHRRRNFLRTLWQHRSSPGDNHNDGSDAIDLSLLAAPEELALRSEARHALMQALARLRHEHRAVLVLHYYLDVPCHEIARILDCPEGTVYSRLYYARRTVQAHLEKAARTTGNQADNP